MVLNDCTICSVYGPDNMTLQARVRVKCTGEQITLHFKKSDEITESERVRIDFFDSKIGYIQTYCELFIRRNYDPLILEPWMADCEILEVIDIVQRQKDLRAKMEREVRFVSSSHGEFTGVIQNISVGGLYFVTRTKLNNEEEFEFRYTFIKKEYEVRAVVLREQDLHNGRYGYGCQFLRLPKSAERDIRQYVYRQQLSKVW
ncbi:MAG: PilZ domain-containing protein [Dorea sp.]|nr:PilZ domain-containing protein [Dorea sp.]